MSLNDFWSCTKETIKIIQEYFDSNIATLRRIEKKSQNKMEVTTGEKAILEYALRFQDCSKMIDAFMKDKIKIEDEVFCNELCNLQDLRTDFDNVFADALSENMKA